MEGLSHILCTSLIIAVLLIQTNFANTSNSSSSSTKDEIVLNKELGTLNIVKKEKAETIQLPEELGGHSFKIEKDPVTGGVKFNEAIKEDKDRPVEVKPAPNDTNSNDTVSPQKVLENIQLKLEAREPADDYLLEDTYEENKRYRTDQIKRADYSYYDEEPMEGRIQDMPLPLPQNRPTEAPKDDSFFSIFESLFGSNDEEPPVDDRFKSNRPANSDMKNIGESLKPIQHEVYHGHHSPVQGRNPPQGYQPPATNYARPPYKSSIRENYQTPPPRPQSYDYDYEEYPNKPQRKEVTKPPPIKHERPLTLYDKLRKEQEVKKPQVYQTTFETETPNYPEHYIKTLEKEKLELKSQQEVAKLTTSTPAPTTTEKPKPVAKFEALQASEEIDEQEEKQKNQWNLKPTVSDPEEDESPTVPYNMAPKSTIDRKDVDVEPTSSINDIKSERIQDAANFYDFINLPVHYSTKDTAIPLISNSYANTKIQGLGATKYQKSKTNGDKYYNHKYEHEQSTTGKPNWLTARRTQRPVTTTRKPVTSTRVNLEDYDYSDVEIGSSAMLGGYGNKEGFEAQKRKPVKTEEKFQVVKEKYIPPKQEVKTEKNTVSYTSTTVKPTTTTMRPKTTTTVRTTTKASAPEPNKNQNEKSKHPQLNQIGEFDDYDYEGYPAQVYAVPPTIQSKQDTPFHVYPSAPEKEVTTPIPTTTTVADKKPLQEKVNATKPTENAEYEYYDYEETPTTPKPKIKFPSLNKNILDPYNKQKPLEVKTTEKYRGPTERKTTENPIGPTEGSPPERYRNPLQGKTTEKYKEPTEEKVTERYRAPEMKTTERNRAPEVKTTERYRAPEVKTTERYRAPEVKTTERYRAPEVKTTERYRVPEVTPTERYKEKMKPEKVDVVIPTKDEFTISMPTIPSRIQNTQSFESFNKNYMDAKRPYPAPVHEESEEEGYRPPNPYRKPVEDKKHPIIVTANKPEVDNNVNIVLVPTKVIQSNIIDKEDGPPRYDRPEASYYRHTTEHPRPYVPLGSEEEGEEDEYSDSEEVQQPLTTARQPVLMGGMGFTRATQPPPKPVHEFTTEFTLGAVHGQNGPGGNGHYVASSIVLSPYGTNQEEPFRPISRPGMSAGFQVSDEGSDEHESSETQPNPHLNYRPSTPPPLVPQYHGVQTEDSKHAEHQFIPSPQFHRPGDNKPILESLEDDFPNTQQGSQEIPLDYDFAGIQTEPKPGQYVIFSKPQLNPEINVNQFKKKPEVFGLPAHKPIPHPHLTEGPPLREPLLSESNIRESHVPNQPLYPPRPTTSNVQFHTNFDNQKLMRPHEKEQESMPSRPLEFSMEIDQPQFELMPPKRTTTQTEKNPFSNQNIREEIPKVEATNYPRPHWEKNGKPGFMTNTIQNKNDNFIRQQLPPQPNEPPRFRKPVPPNRPPPIRKPSNEPLKHNLPNILPQFRPNAKIGGPPHRPFHRPPGFPPNRRNGPPGRYEDMRFPYQKDGKFPYPMQDKTLSHREFEVEPNAQEIIPKFITDRVRVSEMFNAESDPYIAKDRYGVAPLNVETKVEGRGNTEWTRPQPPTYKTLKRHERTPVTTLQKLKQTQHTRPHKNPMIREDMHNGTMPVVPPMYKHYKDDESEKTVYVVYPTKNYGSRDDSFPPIDRTQFNENPYKKLADEILDQRPKRPLLPNMLKLKQNTEREEFPYKKSDQVPLLNPTKKPHNTNYQKYDKEKIRFDFPYGFIKPEGSGQDHKKLIRKDPESIPQDEEIRPNLQDYTPFATKSPIVIKNNEKLDMNLHLQNNNQWNQVQEVNEEETQPQPPVNVITKDSELTNRDKDGNIIVSLQNPSSQYQTLQKDASGSEFTVGAVMHTVQQKSDGGKQGQVASVPLDKDELLALRAQAEETKTPVNLNINVNERIQNGQVIKVSMALDTKQDEISERVDIVQAPPETAPPSSVNEKFNFQAPFQPSVSIDPNAGWSLMNEDSNSTEAQKAKFDIENFKPELISGFKPLYDRDDINNPINEKKQTQEPEKIQLKERDERKIKS